MAKKKASLPTILFSPKGGCAQALIRAIHAARHSIQIMIYEFTHQGVGDAVIEAHKRGVDVRVVMDYRQQYSNYSVAPRLRKAGIKHLYLDKKHHICHVKMLIVDHRIVWAGSFNFTNNAENKNAEVLFKITRLTHVRACTANWAKHKAHSLKYTGQKKPPKGMILNEDADELLG